MKQHAIIWDLIPFDRLVEDYNVPQGGVKFNAMYGKNHDRRREK